MSAPAYALDIGTCDTPEGLSAKIAEEGHKIVATMDRIGISLDRGGVRRDIAQLVTATPDLKSWYIVNGDEPLSTPSTRMCVAAKGFNLEINDYRFKDKPTLTRYYFKRDEALAECDEMEEKFVVGENTGIRCNELYEGMRNLEEATGERVAIQGMGYRGTLMTMIATTDEGRGYRMLATAPKGATGIAARGIGFSYSDWILGVLDIRRQRVNRD